MTTAKRVFVALGTALLLLLTATAVALVAVSTMDLNRARPWLNSQISASLERHFEIRGDLSLHWQRNLEGITLLERWVPLPVVVVNDLVLVNPQWSAKSDMATVGRARFGVELIPLVSHTVVLRGLEADNPDIALERLADGRNNWTLQTSPSQGPPWQVRIGDLSIHNGRLDFNDTAHEIALHGKITTLEPADPKAMVGGKSIYGAEFIIDGHYRKAKVHAEGRGGRVLSLRDGGGDFPLLLNARSGQVSLRAQGVLANPRALSGLNFNVALNGPSMAMLYPLTGLLLPSTPPFTTTGNLVGKFKPDAAAWEYRNFSGRVGSSDVKGNLSYRSQQPRPKLTGNVTSELLQFSDLGPLIGAGDNPPDPAAAEAAEQKGGKATADRPGKILPHHRFLTNRWSAMDVDVNFTAHRIVRNETLPIDDLKSHIVMDDAVLTLAPVSLNLAGGAIDGTLSMDGRHDPLHGTVRLDIKALKLAQLFPTADENLKSAVGQLDGAVAMASSGNSIAELLGAGSGEARIYVRNGKLSKALLEKASLNVGGIVATKLFGDREVSIRCAVADLLMHDGLGVADNFHISTDEATIDVTGNIDFKNEQLALEIKPASTRLKWFSLRSPLYVRGTFAQPDVGLHKGPLLMRAGAAAALAVFAAPAALLPITVPGAEDDADCRALLAAAGKRPVAMPTEKRR